MKNITLKDIYKKVIDLEQEVKEIKKGLLDDPELREDFIMRMRDIELERSIKVDDFGKRYGLK